MVITIEDCVFNAPKVVFLNLKVDTIVTKVKVMCGVVRLIIFRLSWEFLSTEF